MKNLFYLFCVSVINAVSEMGLISIFQQGVKRPMGMGKAPQFLAAQAITSKEGVEEVVPEAQPVREQEGRVSAMGRRPGVLLRDKLAERRIESPTFHPPSDLQTKNRAG